VKLDRIDHFVLTVHDVKATCDFYSRVLGMEVEEFEPVATRSSSVDRESTCIRAERSSSRRPGNQRQAREISAS